MTFFSTFSYTQCVPGVVDQAIWGTPDDFFLGFTVDANITDVDTIQVTQGVDTTVVLQYLLPKKQAITSPITGTATVTSLQIQGVTGLPIGMNWALDVDAAADNNTYYPQSNRYGAVTMCGLTYASAGIRTLTVSTMGCGELSGISQCQAVTIPLYIEVLPGSGGNTGFSFSPPVGCEEIDVDFEALFQSPDPILFPVEFEWDLGDGSTASGTTVTAHNYNVPADYAVQMDAVLYEYYISSVSIIASGGWWSDIEEVSSIQNPELYGNFNGVALPEQSSGTNKTWSVDIPLSSTTVNCQFYDADTNIPIFGSGDDDLGSGSTTILPFDGMTGAISTGNYITSFTINKRVSGAPIVFNDTVKVYSPSIGTVTSSNGTLFCEGDSTVLDLGTGSFDFVQWYNDTTLLLGENNTSMTVYTDGDYYAEVLNSGNICSGNTNIISVAIDNIGSIAVTQTADGLEIDNTNGYDVQWFSGIVPIPNATNDVLTDLSSGNPFSVSITNAAGCSVTSAEFFAIMSGTSTQSGNTLSSDEGITFEASDFSLCLGQEIAWAASLEADGAITDMAGLQAAIDAGWVYPSTSLNTFDASCSNVTFPPGDYYMTPFSADALLIEDVYWNANTDSGYCDSKMEICIGISGTDYSINPLKMQLPNGVEIDVLAELAAGIIPAGTPIDETLWGVATSQYGDPMCIDLISIMGYYDNPNGTWKVIVPNEGTGALDFSIADFNIVVNASSCDSLATDQVIPIAGVSGTVAAGETKTFEIIVPPFPSNFPEITPECLLFGEATTFSSSCVSGIEDLIDVANINLYPNPNNGLFNLEFDLNTVSDVNIAIIDITGRKVLQRNYPNANNRFSETFDLKNNLNSGFYFLDIQIGNEHTQKKFIVK